MTREEAAERLLVVARGVVAGVRDVAELSDAALDYAKACWCQHCRGHGYTPGYVLETKKLIQLHCSHCDGNGISRCTSECWCDGTGEEPKT